MYVIYKKNASRLFFNIILSHLIGEKSKLKMIHNKKTVFLVMGGGGYLGSVMVPILLSIGYHVRVIDRFFWGKDVLSPHENLSLIEADTRSYPKTYLKDIDIIIDLASISNDYAAELKPQVTLDINYHARVRTALMAKKYGVKKYILASSCSVYGFGNEILDETSKPSPLTTYAKASLLAENATLQLSDNNFCVTVLRQGTLHGISPRMRFDLVLNTMTLSLFKNNFITIQDGNQWRPIVHVTDSARAFIQVAQTPMQKINGEVFNVGASEQNYQIRNLAQLVISNLDSTSKVIVQDNQSDSRSYQVSFEKLKHVIGYQTKKILRDGVREVYLGLKTNRITDSIQTRTVDWYKYLLSQDPYVLDIKHEYSQKETVPHLQ